MMQIYKIDDGADHWVIAHDVPDACVLWVEHLRGQGLTGEEIAIDGVEITPLTPEQATATPFWEDNPDNPVGTMQSDFERDPTRRYVGCSEG